MATKKQGYDSRLDESQGARKGGKKRGGKATHKARRDESKGMEKAMGRRAFSSVATMDKGNRRVTTSAPRRRTGGGDPRRVVSSAAGKGAVRVEKHRKMCCAGCSHGAGCKGKKK